MSAPPEGLDDMRKRIIRNAVSKPESSSKWLNLEQMATVEVTSEAPGFPAESVFVPDSNTGWRAATGGAQTLRVIFDVPTSLRIIELHFAEPELERTQEFRLGWSAADGGPAREIVRQQWTFSPQGSTQEVEHYEVNLECVSTIELSINPDISDRSAKVTLLKWRMG